MKHLLTLTTLLISSLAMGQDYAEYPFPYNPDGNADGYIGLNDMLDLLSVYGQQYPESFYSDSTRAILDLGDMTYPECTQEAFMAGKSWRVLSQEDFFYWFKHFLDDGQEVFDSGESSNSNYSAWIRLNDGDPGRFNFAFRDGEQGELYGVIYNLWNTGSNLYYPSQKEDGNGGKIYPFTQCRCVLATQVLPEIEFHLVYGNRSEVQSAVSDSLSNGWKLGNGISGFGVTSTGVQPIWRYAE